MNFEQGTPLAKRQDRALNDLEENYKVSREDSRMLKGNLWIRMAEKCAPSNLVVRHLILLDLINDRTNNYFRINKLLKILCPDIWAEGYSYWKYTRKFVSFYEKEFGIGFMYTNKCDCWFVRTAYQGKDGKLWPAPFGDLRKEPLDDTTLSAPFSQMMSEFKLDFVYKKDNIYIFWPYPLGFNTHCVTEKHRIEIFNGVPQGFKWYTGYENKYSSKKEELKDTFLNKKRIRSVVRKRFGR